MFKKFKWTIVLLLLTPILFIVSFLVAGLGAGWSLLPPAIVFPWGVLGMTTLNGKLYLVAALGIMQLPLYGYFIDRSMNKKRSLLILTAVHLALLLFLILTQSAEF